MNPFVGNLENLTIGNDSYRKVLFTDNLQLVVMMLKPNEEIGREIHNTTTQFIRIEQGEAIVMIGRTSDPQSDKKFVLSKNDQDTIIIPQGIYHNIINKSNTEPLKLYTIYSPPEHHPKTHQKNRPSDNINGREKGLSNKNMYNRLKTISKN